MDIRITLLGVVLVFGACCEGKKDLPMLRGINRSGTEFNCIKGVGIFDGPDDDASIDAMLKWKINAVRIPLNEDCWCGEKFVENPEFSGTKYQDKIESYVRRLRSRGLYVILELHWSEGQYQGDTQAMDWDNKEKCYEEGAKCQKPMPDKNLAPRFWREVADKFKDDEDIIFDLFNEPYPNSAIKNKDGNEDIEQAWKCWRYGTPQCPGLDSQFEVAGMESLIKEVRSTGAKNLILLGGLRFANHLEGWLENLPDDPEHNLAASMHNYNFNSCTDEACWERGIGEIAKSHPVIVGEIGQNDCKHDYIDRLMTWLEQRGISYLGWTWNHWGCGSGPSLITDDSGTPTEYGEGFKKFVADHVTA